MKKLQYRTAGIKNIDFAQSANEFCASADFRAYLLYSNAAESLRRTMKPESEWRDADAKRDAAACRIARATATDAHQLFEKLFVWRSECLESGPDDYLCFNDLFPLSVYFDLKAIVRAPRICPATDDGLLESLKTWNAASEE